METNKFEMPKFELVWLPPSKIMVLNGEDGYQRSASESKIKKIIESYDKNLVNPVKVYKSLGGYYAFNGQHTLCLLKRIFGDNAKVPCLLYDIEDKEAALLFEKQNGICSNPTPADRHKSKIFRNDKAETRIKHICEIYGFSMDNYSQKKNNFRCYNDIDNAYNNLNDYDFEKMIRIIKNAWYNDEMNTSKEIVVGLSQLIKRFGDKIDEKSLTNRLGVIKPKEMVREIRSRKSIDGANRYINAFLVAYNKGKKKKLSI